MNSDPRRQLADQLLNNKFNNTYRRIVLSGSDNEGYVSVCAYMALYVHGDGPGTELECHFFESAGNTVSAVKIAVDMQRFEVTDEQLGPQELYLPYGDDTSPEDELFLAQVARHGVQNPDLPLAVMAYLAPFEGGSFKVAFWFPVTADGHVVFEIMKKRIWKHFGP